MTGRTIGIIALLLAAGAIPLLAADPPAAPPPPASPWSGSLGAGLAITSGNTDTQNYNLSFSTRYDPKTRLVFKADALYLRGESQGQKQLDQASADVREEYALSDRTFTFGEITYSRDPFKGLDYLVAPLVGGGYRIIKSTARNLTIDGAAGGDVESDVGVGRSSSGAVKIGENFDWAISPSSKLTQKITGLWKTNDFSDSLYHFDIGITTTITKRAELKVAYNYDYKNEPVPSTLKKADSALFAAFLFKY